MRQNLNPAHIRRVPSLAGRRVLVIAPHSSYRTAPFLAAAQRLDVDVLIASPGQHSIVSALSEGLHINLQDPDAALATILREASCRPFAAILGTDDVTTELAARTARALALPHNPPDAVRCARRKDLARACLSQAGVPVPSHRRIDLRQSLAVQAATLSFPCVVKPIALSASRGVIRVDDIEQFLRACARIERILADEATGEERWVLLAEDFIPGKEIAVEAILNQGELKILSIFDKPNPLDGPYFEETYYVTPSRLTGVVQNHLHTQLAAGCRAYGLSEGPVHAEFRINERGIWVLEIAARTIGGLCARLLRIGTGYGLEELVLAQAMGDPLPIAEPQEAAGVLMIPTPKPGILRRVEGLVAAERVRFIDELHIAVREGYELVPLPEGSNYLGFIFARAPTPVAVESALRQAHACLNFVVAPLWKAAVA
jgi:biotin carboxylase